MPAFGVTKLEERCIYKLMDRQQQQKVEEAAQQFNNALVCSFWALLERTVGAQEQGVRLTEDFFNQVINNLGSQAENAWDMTQQLADHQQRAAQAWQTLTQESVAAYMGFLNSMFPFSQDSIEPAQRGSERAASGDARGAGAQRKRTR